MKRPQLRPFRLAASVACAALVVACASEVAPAPRARSQTLSPPLAPDFQAPEWSGTPANAEVIARVGAAPIGADALRAELAAEPGLSPRRALDRIIEREVVAQQAQRAGLSDAAPVTSAWRQALVREYLADVFEEEVRPKDIPLEQVRKLYYQPQIRQLYDHAPAWRSAQLIIQCCRPKQQRCDAPGVVACFDEAGRVMADLYGELKRRAAPYEGDPDAMLALFKRFQAEKSRAYPSLTFQEVPFYYDPSKPHSEQHGYDVMDEDYVRAVIGSEMATVAGPVETQFGHHIVVKLDYQPEQRKGPDDPEVIADIRDNAFGAFRRAAFRSRLAKLSAAHGVELHPEPLELLQVRAGAVISH